MTGKSLVLNDSPRMERRVIQPYGLRRQGLNRNGVGLKTSHVILFFAFHIPLALLMHRVPVIATTHGLATLLLGLWWAISDKQMERVAYVGAYIMGSEVLWRMSGSQSFWEYGKYAIAAIFIVSMVRHGRLKPRLLPLIYFALLIPSVLLTAQVSEFDNFRQQISFNLSGPFALMICCLFFSRRLFTMEQLQRMFLAALAPILSIAFIAVVHASTVSRLTFGGTSNKSLSGGWGPNQVSAALGLGGLLAFLIILMERKSLPKRVLMFLASAFLLVESAVTFSRTGPYLGISCAVLASVFLFRDSRYRVKLIASIAALVIVAVLVLPQINAFTGGALAARFERTDSTGRDKIILADLEIWRENPILGVGPGGAKMLHARNFRKEAAHTEYSRLLSEHGSLGLVALILVVIIPIGNFRRARTNVGKALVVALAGFGLAFMLVCAMRLAIPAFLLGLSCASFVTDAPVASLVKRLRARLNNRAAALKFKPGIRVPHSSSEVGPSTLLEA